jgi:hypothetical protein
VEERNEMHTKPMSESEGEFTAVEQVGTACPSCKQRGQHKCETWESSCGGYEDYKYTCAACGHVWWVDGIDS